MDKQSVRISVDMFYYAKILKDDETGITYETSVHLPGVNVVALRTNSSIGSFYADDGIFETFILEGDRDLQISFSGLSTEIVAELTGANYDYGILEDKKTDIPPYVAAGFRTQKSDGSYRYVWLYKGRFTKADLDGYSKTTSLSPQPDIYTFKAINRVYDGAWRRMMDSEIPSMTVNWFGSPKFDPSSI